MSTVTQNAARDPVAIRDGLLCGPLSQLAQVRLAGSKCTNCGETSLGTVKICPNCGRDSVQNIALGNRGVLWSFTIVRHRPPGNYKGRPTISAKSSSFAASSSENLWVVHMSTYRQRRVKCSV